MRPRAGLLSARPETVEGALRTPFFSRAPPRIPLFRLPAVLRVIVAVLVSRPRRRDAVEKRLGADDSRVRPMRRGLNHPIGRDDRHASAPLPRQPHQDVVGLLGRTREDDPDTPGARGDGC